MATIVLGAVGLAVGASVGQPQMGFSIGTAVGSAIDAKAQRRIGSTARLSDLRVSGSQYGAPISQIWGSFRTQGNMIWVARDLRGNTLIEHRHKHSTFFGLQKLPSTYTYTASFAILVCRGPVSRIKRIWAPNRTVYDANATPTSTYTIRIYLGDETQGQDSLMVAQTGATGGVANTPGYRGACYVVFQDLPLGEWGNQIPNLSFEVERWGALTALVQDSFNRADGNVGNADSGQTWQQSGGTVLVSSNQGMSTIAQAYIDSGISDATIQMTISNRDVTDGSSRIIARFVDTNNYLYWGESTGPHHYELVRKQAGLFNTITTTAITPANGDVVKLVLNGSSLQGYVNGVLQATGTETFQQTETRHGFGSAAATSTVDDFTVTPLTVTTIKLSDILADIFEQSGLTSTQYDVTAATDVVSGMALQERQSASNALDGALAIYNTQLVEVDGKIKASKRGGAAVAAPAVTDLGAAFWSPGNEPAVKVETKRVQELELPFRLDLTYFSPTTKYQAATQGATRYTKTALQRSVTITAPIVLVDTTARQTAETLLYRQWIEREEFTFSLPMAYLGLVPGDVLTLPISGNLLRVRLIEVNLSVPGPIQCVAVLDDAAVLTQVIAGPDLTAASDEAAAIIATSLVAWSGNAIVNDDADSIGFYLVANGTTAGYWPGAAIYWSRDGGASYQELDAAPDGATLGTTLTALPAFTNTGVWDTLNTLDVNITAGDIPVTTSDSDMLAGANLALVGDELIQFAVVTALGGTQYRLSRLLRGQRGTDGRWGEHVVGERFAQFDAGNLRREALGFDLRAKSILVKALTPGQTLGDVSPITVYISGEEFKTYAPVLISATRDGSQNITVAWYRRDRKYVGLQDLYDEPISETSESYTVAVLSGTQKTISGISNATSAVVTATGHGFSVTQVVFITGVYGMVQINGTLATITAVGDVNHFTVSVDTSQFGVYTASPSGGTAERAVRQISASSPTAAYSSASQVTDFGSNQPSVRVRVAQTGRYGAGYWGAATV